jgi:hypothetical protein
MKKKNLILLVFILLAGIIISSPYIIRMLNGNSYIVNSEAYYNLRLYESGTSNDTVQERYAPINIINYIPYNEPLMRISVILLGMLSILLSYLVLKNNNMTDKNIWAILLLMITSPIFIYTFMNYNPFAFTIILTLLVLLLNNDILKGAVFSLIPFIDIHGAIISFLFLIIYFYANNRMRKNIVFMIISSIAIIAGITLNMTYGFTLLQNIPIQAENMITDIGANIGFSFSMIILSIIGIILLWEKGLKNFIIHMTILFCIFAATFNNSLRVYLNFLLVVYAGFAYIYLTRRKWSIPIIKKVTLLLIVCSILFTTLVYVTKIVNTEPSNEYAKALIFLDEKSFPGERILSMPSNGYMLEYYTHNPVFVDEKSIIYEPEKMIEFQNISVSRSLEKTEEFLTRNNIKYIFIDTGYKDYLEETGGFLFLLEESNKIIQIFNNTEVEIWMYAW